MLLGISSFTYGWSVGLPSQKPDRPFTAFDLVNRTLDFGLDCLQIADNLPLHRLPDSEARALNTLLTRNEIRLEVGARGLTEKHLRDYIAVAAYYRAPLLRFVTDQPGHEPTTGQIIRVVRGALPELRDAGIKLGIENHDRFKAAELAAVLTAIDDSTVGICLDTVNSLGAGEDLERVVSELAPYTLNLHVKDFIVKRAPHQMGFVVEGTPAGQGMLNLPGLLDKLSSYGRCESAVLEQWVPPGFSLDEAVNREEQWAIESVQYLKRIPAFQNRNAAKL